MQAEVLRRHRPRLGRCRNGHESGGGHSGPTDQVSSHGPKLRNETVVWPGGHTSRGRWVSCIRFADLRDGARVGRGCTARTVLLPATYDRITTMADTWPTVLCAQLIASHEDGRRRPTTRRTVLVRAWRRICRRQNFLQPFRSTSSYPTTHSRLCSGLVRSRPRRGSAWCYLSRPPAAQGLLEHGVATRRGRLTPPVQCALAVGRLLHDAGTLGRRRFCSRGPGCDL